MRYTRFEWKPFLQYGTEIVVDKDCHLFHQGEVGKGFYYVDEGQVKISVFSSEGHERIIDFVGAGELLGEQGVLGEPYFSTATAMQRSRLFYFSIDCFHTICRLHGEATEIFLASLIAKMRLLVQTFSLSSAPKEYQLAYFLYRLYIKYGSEQLPITQVALAHYMGTSRITVYKLLKKLKEKELLSVNRNAIIIVDPTRLASFIQELSAVD